MCNNFTNGSYYLNNLSNKFKVQRISINMAAPTVLCVALDLLQIITI